MERDSWQSKYFQFSFIPPTSNLCERLFYFFGYTFNDRRKGDPPANIQMEVILYINFSLWCLPDIAEIVQLNL